MPSRNVIKQYAPDTYYHIYNRGVNKQEIFLDDTDYQYYLYLLKRYLSPGASKDTYGRLYPSYTETVELVTFCLMPNHFHLLVYQYDERSIESFMRSLATAYTSYFNKKYKRVGHLFQGSFKASRIDSDSYLEHISRYIHRNPSDYGRWQYSSWPYYVKSWYADWIKPEKILDLFNSSTTDRVTEYRLFVADYKDYEKTLSEVKSYTAN